MIEQKKVRSLAEIEQDLRKAGVVYLEAEAEESRASSCRIKALNNLNNLQKEFDVVVKQMHSDAPRASGWVTAVSRGESL